MRRIGLSVAILAASLARAGDSSTFPLRIPAPGGEVILPDEASKRGHDEWHFAAVRRVDDTLYVSGVMVIRRKGEGADVGAFKHQVRRALERLRSTLEAAGSDFQHVSLINTFHVFQSPNFTGTRHEHFVAFHEVIGEFIVPPYPAWTAVGTPELLSDNGLVEIQLIVKVKK